MMAKPAIIEALALMAQIKSLSIVVSLTEGGQDRRWQLLQDWLDANPHHRKLVEKCLKQSPAEALATICAETEIDLELMRAFDHGGVLERMAINTITTLQTLYKERAGIAQGELND
jgi:hypothetical protein